MGRARMYSRRTETEMKKSAARAMSDKMYQEIPDKNITTDEVKCKKCGFKARYKFLRCPECNEVQE